MTELTKSGDAQQYPAKPHDSDPDEGVKPNVKLMWMTPDPLGAMALFTGVYKGKFYSKIEDVTDEDRYEALAEVQRTHLQAPLEVVKMHFLLEGVDRAFTQQMTRQRTAVFAQESMRFSVLGDLIDATTLPPSLAGTIRYTVCEICYGEGVIPRPGWSCGCGPGISHVANCGRGVPADPCPNPDHLPSNKKAQRQREIWDQTIRVIDKAYHLLVNDGMPAEDARGLLPHCTATRVNYVTDLRNLKEHAGNRLCTQAQFHWRDVFSQIVEEIRNFGMAYCPNRYTGKCDEDPVCPKCKGTYLIRNWQMVALADSGLFRPVCYQIGHCPFQANFDRACTIRDRVEDFAKRGVSSEKWHEPHSVTTFQPGHGLQLTETIPAIHPAEWKLDPGAART